MVRFGRQKFRKEKGLDWNGGSSGTEKVWFGRQKLTKRIGFTGED